MITLKYFGDHIKELRQLLWTSTSYLKSGDVLFVSQEGTTHHAHRLLLVAFLPALAPLLAPTCEGNHEEEATIFLPEVGNTLVKAALEALYTKGDPQKMASILVESSLSGSFDELEQIFKKEINDCHEEIIENTASNKDDFCEITLMNGSTVVQCQRCLEAVEDARSHKCQKTQEKTDSQSLMQDLHSVRDVKLHFEEIVFKNGVILFRCLQCDSQFNKREEASIHMRSHQNRANIAAGALLQNEIQCSLCNYKCASKTDFRKHRKEQHNLEFSVSKSPQAPFSLDHFVAKLNRKKDKIFVCRKCKKKCRGELGAKMHSKMKCGASNKFILPAGKKRQVLPLENDVKEMPRLRKNIEITRTTNDMISTNNMIMPGGKKVKNTKTNQPNTDVSCDQCRKVCSSNRYLDIHRRRKHPISVHQE